MIKLSLINGTAIVLNSDLIELIEATPDTMIALTSGKKMLVKETVDEVIERIVQFRQQIGIIHRDFVELPHCENE